MHGCQSGWGSTLEAVGREDGTWGTDQCFVGAGEQTKALVTQLTLFNKVLMELREDIRDQVRWLEGLYTISCCGRIDPIQVLTPCSVPLPPHSFWGPGLEIGRVLLRGAVMLRSRALTPALCLAGEGDVPDPEHHHGVSGLR